jgi:menaquinone-dependent protoporphyrinogen IX oxidase
MKHGGSIIYEEEITSIIKVLKRIENVMSDQDFAAFLQNFSKQLENIQDNIENHLDNFLTELSFQFAKHLLSAGSKSYFTFCYEDLQEMRNVLGLRETIKL